MVRELARAVLPRSVTVLGRRHVVAAPTVQTALLLVALAPGRSAGVEEDVQVWEQTLGEWLPEALVEALSGLAEDEGRGAAERSVVTALLFEGTPPPRPAVARYLGSATAGRGEDADLLASMLRFDAADAVARVSAAFHVSPQQVLAWPWPSFLLWLREAARMKAQTDLSLLSMRSLPYVRDETERRRVLDRLQVLAGVRDEEATMTKQQRGERGLAEIERMLRATGMARASA